MQLEQSQIWKTEIGALSVIAVERGGLWLTFEGQDVVLQAGQQWSAPRRGEVMAQSLGGAASFTIAHTQKTSANQPKHGSPWRHPRNLLSHLFEPQMKPHF